LEEKGIGRPSTYAQILSVITSRDYVNKEDKRFVKIFEMPMLGFFGFPPFALECYLLYRAFLLFRERFLHGQKLIPAVTAVLVVLYCLLAFTGIDRWTVEDYKVIFS